MDIMAEKHLFVCKWSIGPLNVMQFSLPESKGCRACGYFTSRFFFDTRSFVAGVKYFYKCTEVPQSFHHRFLKV